MTDRASVLAVYAHPREGAGLSVGDGCAAACVGVGKVAAALGTIEALDRFRPRAVLSFGLCGRYPGAGLAVGAPCLVERTFCADEGVETPAGFSSLAQMGLADEGAYDADAGLVARVLAVAGPLPRVVAATVSTCAGTDALARRRRARLAAEVETMESAAVAAACRLRAVPWVEIRVVSNETGDRDRAAFDLEGAAARCRALAARVLAALEETKP